MLDHAVTCLIGRQIDRLQRRGIIDRARADSLPGDLGQKAGAAQLKTPGAEPHPIA